MKAPLISIGASKEAVVAARSAILDILKAGRADDVTITALTCLSNLCSVNNVTVSNCNLEGR